MDLEPPQTAGFFVAESRFMSKENIRFCQEPSRQYLKELDNHGGDPRSVIGAQAIRQAGAKAERGWRPAWDARDAY